MRFNSARYSPPRVLTASDYLPPSLPLSYPAELSSTLASNQTTEDFLSFWPPHQPQLVESFSLCSATSCHLIPHHTHQEVLDLIACTLSNAFPGSIQWLGIVSPRVTSMSVRVYNICRENFKVIRVLRVPGLWRFLMGRKVFLTTKPRWTFVPNSKILSRITPPATAVSGKYMAAKTAAIIGWIQSPWKLDEHRIEEPQKVVFFSWKIHNVWQSNMNVAAFQLECCVCINYKQCFIYSHLPADEFFCQRRTHIKMVSEFQTVL